MSTKIKLNKKQEITLIITVILVFCVVGALIVGMSYSVRNSVYSERKQLLGRLTEACAYIVDDNIEHDWEITDIISDHALASLPHYERLEDYFSDTRDRAVYKDLTFFFVDRNGKYYSSDGKSGKIVDMTYYTDASDDRISYISSLPHLGAEASHFIFRKRFSSPLPVKTSQGEAELLYCGVLFDINELNETVSNEFTGENNTFIYDDTTGVMLYKNFGIRLLLGGFNIYSKLDLCHPDHGEDPAALEQACRNQETVVISFRVDGEEFYFCSAPVTESEWSLAFVVQSKYMNAISGSAFGRIILYVTLIVLLLGATLLFITFFFYKASAAEKSMQQIRALNAELESATKAKSEFLSNMSHDIRTPINGIMGMTVIAKSVPGNPEKTRECLSRIEGASQHLLSLINDVLDMSRIERGRTEIAMNPLDIRQLTENCASIIHGQMEGRDLELITEIDCTHTKLLGDDLHLRQIFINILGNAVKFTRDGGKIWFRLREENCTEEDTTLIFEVEDTGIGMRPEFLSRIFDAFTQDEGGARSNYKGTGLGMAITKQLTELMGGTIEVESELEKGSKFIVTIPFLLDPAPEEEEEEVLPADGNIEGLRLLLAEDNELNMDIAVELLEEAGAVLTPVTDGAQALETFEKSVPGTFDAILMDVMMPVMNGLEAAKAIRALDHPDAKTVPILAMTANAFDSDIKATRDAGMNAHLVKPIDIDIVVKTIAYHARKGV